MSWSGQRVELKLPEASEWKFLKSIKCSENHLVMWKVTHCFSTFITMNVLLLPSCSLPGLYFAPRGQVFFTDVNFPAKFGGKCLILQSAVIIPAEFIGLGICYVQFWIFEVGINDLKWLCPVFSCRVPKIPKQWRCWQVFPGVKSSQTLAGIRVRGHSAFEL